MAKNKSKPAEAAGAGDKGKAKKDNGGKKKDATPAQKKSGAKKAAAKPSEQKPSLYQRTRQFFREVRIELKKVTWPSRKETLASTSVVLVVVFIVAVYLGLVDMALSRALKLILN